jgi:hypothetical protein
MTLCVLVPRSRHRYDLAMTDKILYLDVDGVLQYAKDNQWKPRLEAEAFLEWAVRHFCCRWLTNWPDPNRTVSQQLGITVPEGIVEVRWRTEGPSYPFKASAISDAEDWLWLEDEPSEFDLEALRRRGKLAQLIVVDRYKPYILMSQIREMLEVKLLETKGESGF